MRVLPAALTATMAAAVLAIGPAQSLPTGGEVAASDAAIVKVQQKEMTPGPGPGMGGPGKGGGPPAMGGPGMGGGKMRGEGGPQLRSGEKGMRGEGGAQLRSERGFRGDGDRRRGDGDRRRGDGFYFGFGPGGPSLGYGRPGRGEGAGCGRLRERALETGSPYWWRQYRACRGG